MSRRRRRALTRAAGVVGVVTQVLVGLMGIVIFPAAFVSFLTGAAGVRLVARDLEAAALRLGVALLASGVGLAAGLASGALPMALTAIVSTGSFGLAWVLVRQLEREERAAFGIRHRDWLQRDRELRRRRDRLQDGQSVDDLPEQPRSPSAAADGSPAEDAAWWEDLE